VVDPTEPFDAQRYLAATDAVLERLAAAQSVPLVCGGTGLYVRALRLGLIEAPHDAHLRTTLEADDARAPGSSLRRLAELDPASATTIDPHNGQYVRRALEICLLTGQPASALREAHAAQPPRLPMHIFVVDLPDALLRARMVARVGAMLRQGLIDEVKALRAQGVPPTAKPMRAVGYREVAAYLDGTLARADLEAAMVQSTWQYARRQRIWLRREARTMPQGVTWLPSDDAPRAQALLVDALRARLT
jgi:tRNA dimethylallyltransferase